MRSVRQAPPVPPTRPSRATWQRTLVALLALGPVATAAATQDWRPLIALVGIAPLGLWQRRPAQPALALGLTSAADSAAETAPGEIPSADLLPAEQDLKGLSSRVGRLCAAAWVLSSAHPGEARAAGFLDAITDATSAVRAIEDAMRRRSLGEARRLFAATAPEIATLEAAIAEADASLTAPELQARLGGFRAVTNDILSRLLEYYALLAARNPATAQKLIAVTSVLVARFGGAAGFPSSTLRVLRRRGLLPADAQSSLPPDVAQAGEDLSRRIRACHSPRPAELEAFDDELAALLAQMGHVLYIRAGLSEAVALVSTLADKRTARELEHLDSFDRAVNDVDTGAEPELVEEEAADDPVALELLRDTESELRLAVRDNACRERGFYLEDEEARATTAGAEHRGWATAVVQAAACRNAIDRLARRHAAAHQDGHAPPSTVPMSIARTLIRAGIEIGSTLQDQANRAMARGQLERAEQTIRFIHRLARARYGLALLADLSVDGSEEPVAEVVGDLISS